MSALTRCCGALLALSASCSFIGAGVPDKPPPPQTCPQTVIVLDMVGTSLTLLPGVLALATAGAQRDTAAVGAVLFGVPFTIFGLVAGGQIRLRRLDGWR